MLIEDVGIRLVTSNKQLTYTELLAFLKAISDRKMEACMIYIRENGLETVIGNNLGSKTD